METTNTLRALYANCRNAIVSGVAVDRGAIVSTVNGAPANIVEAFEALMGWKAGTIAAEAAQQVADARRMESQFHARMAARAKVQRADAAHNARAEARRLARETVATITEF